MKPVQIILIVVILTAPGCGSQKEILVSKKDGTSFSGELLAVQGDSIYMTTAPGSSERPLKRESILRISKTEVAGLYRAGESHALVGAVLGLVAGSVTGMLIGGASSKPEPLALGLNTVGDMLSGAMVGGAVGLVGGLIIGGAASHGDRTYAPADTAVVSMARYGNKVPEHLR